ncbi:hypothetical protein J6D24_02045 [Candidatus Saccharibacteria bacterium]|nr:hypothetical protein [Candidatus Saccharibacteria bacterium]
MIKVFYGSDRKKIDAEVKKILGTDYEVFDGENLKKEDIVNVFLGTSLFAEKRKILLKDLTPARGEQGEDLYEEIAKYVDTPHTIVIWETNVSQKKTYKDFLKSKNVEAKKFDLADKVDMRAVFNIYDTALVDGARAVKMLTELQDKQDPYMFFGLLVSQAIKKYEWRQGTKEKRVLKELSKVDMQMKTTAVEPWYLVKSFLLRLKTI